MPFLPCRNEKRPKLLGAISGDAPLNIGDLRISIVTREVTEIFAMRVHKGAHNANILSFLIPKVPQPPNVISFPRASRAFEITVTDSSVQFRKLLGSLVHYAVSVRDNKQEPVERVVRE